MEGQIQKRQKVPQDEKCKEGEGSDGACGGIPSHLVKLICRLVIPCLAKHLPANYEQLVALSAATGLCNDDDVARLRDSRGCQRELITVDGPNNNTMSVDQASYNTAGTQIVFVKGGRAFICDAKTGNFIQEINANGTNQVVHGASFNPRGDLIVTACADETARVWSVRTGECLRTLKGHSETVSGDLSFSHDGERIVTASRDGTVRVWNTSTGECMRVLRHKDETRFWSAKYSPDDSMIMTRQWDEEEGEPFPGTDFAWARLYTACIWDAATGECRQMLRGHYETVMSASFSPDGSLVVTGSYDTTARIWRVETGECIHILQGSHFITSAMFSPDGAHVVTASLDRTVRIWDVADGRQLFLYDKSDEEKDYDFSFFACYDPQGTRILAKLGDDRLCILSAPVFRFK